jgi:membrane protein
MPGSSSNVDQRLDPHVRQVWDTVCTSPLPSLWDVRGLDKKQVAKCTWQSLWEDRIFSHAAELGFYFLFSLFPTLICASSILGLAARSASQIYDRLLNYLSLVIPTSAMGMVIKTYEQTTAASSSGKITFGLIATIWSASVGVSAIQEALNAVYKLRETRSYLRARLNAIGLTIVLIVLLSLCLGCMFAGDFFAAWTRREFHYPVLVWAALILVRLVGWTLATAFLSLSFAVTYCWAPDLPRRRWRWTTPGGMIGLIGWLVTSIGFRIYLHFFNSYSVTYGSLGAVVILLMWFYITGLMFLTGAELNSEIEAAAAERHLRDETAPAAPPSDSSTPRAA